MMEQPPDLLTPLSEIIGYSDNESQSQGKWYLACKIILDRSVWDKKAPHVSYEGLNGSAQQYNNL